MSATTRQCNVCGYQTFVLHDKEGDRTCKHCGGLLKIIAREVKWS